MPTLITYLVPWEFSPLVLIGCIGAGWLFWRGLKQRRRDGEPALFWRPLSFYLGLVMIYVVMQTYVDYLSQHMFWVHRLQHLVLHHLAPFLIVLAYPHEVMTRGLPKAWYARLSPIWNSRPVRFIYGFLQNPFIALVLFVGLIYFWLMPSIHFDVMLSSKLYWLMNWSMLIDGLLFWWLIVDDRQPRARDHLTLTYPIRIVILFFANIIQSLIGSHIALSKTVIYNVYSVCGRAWPIDPVTDQQIGGLITWIPSAMMGVLGIVLVIRLWMRASAKQNQQENAIHAAGNTTRNAGNSATSTVTVEN